MFRYQAKLRMDNVVRVRLKALATQYPAYGYLLLHGLLKAEGLVIKQEIHLLIVHNGAIVELHRI